MANRLDEQTGPINVEGQNINVINKKLPVEIGKGSLIFEILLWMCFIIPGLIFLFQKISAKNYLDSLEQRIQGAASEVDNFLDQRVQILNNVVGIVEKSMNLDKDIMLKVAELRSGNKISESNRNEIQSKVDNIYGKLNLAFENYPNLKSQDNLQLAMQKNDYTQREITAARSNYNDLVSRWNQDIQMWPAKKIVAARNNMTTRIPFITSMETKTKAASTFF
ncbi:LemA family protein [Spiroplasma endosymbiont of Crioceris asparagi]|uniref:LemA family protein n=1 Tax=Spiroplasma endosymbiont of Crioceris asparagi TaxID=3066286 RepID=UPI0030CFE44A